MMKNTSVRRALAWALVLVMTLSAVPVGVFAEEAEPVEKCLCTEKCTEDTRREDCPICAQEDADLDAVCQGEEKQAEPQSAEAPVNKEADKKAAEEAAAKAEAEKKAAEEAAAKAEAEKKAAEEAAKAEAEKKAAEEAAAKAKVAAEAKSQEAQDGGNAVTTVHIILIYNGGVYHSLLREERDLPKGEPFSTDYYPMCPGYVFKGWSTNQNATPADASFEIIPMENNKKYYAVWHKPVVTFDLNDGSGTRSTENVNNSLRLSSLPTPTRDGYKFDGWYQDEECNGDIVTADGTYFRDDTTLYAKWTPTCTVTFNGNGGMVGGTADSASVDVPKGQKYTPTQTATRKGYVFVGWATDSNATEATTDITPDKDITLYAVWRKPTVTFNPNGGSVTPTSAELNDNQKLDSLPTPTRDGYIFDGWYRNQDGSGEKIDKDTIFEGDATVYAAWAPITYTVTFNGNGGTLRDSGAAVTEPVSVSYGANVGGPTFERENYTFNGWARNANGTDPVTDLNNLTTTDGASVTLYAQWTYDVRTVTFDAKGGTVSGEPTVTRMTRQNPANTLEELPIPDARKDYRFLGWYLSDGTKVTTETVFDKDTTVTARWFEAIIPDGVEVPDAFFDSDAMKDASGLEILLEKSDDPAVKALRELLIKYVQDNAGKDKTNPLLNLSPEQLEEIDKNVVEMAVRSWSKESQEYTPLTETERLISFPIGLDWPKFENRTLMVVRVHNGELEFLKPYNGTDEGYEKEANGLRIYANKFSTYAVLAVPNIYTIHFDPNGGTMKTKDVQTDADGKLSELPDPGTRTGYTKDSDLNKVWKNGRNYVNQNTVYTANTTLVAQWTPITYKVTFNGNGGNVKNTLKTTDTVTVAYDVEITPATFVRDYYKLTGWARNADGTEAVTTLKNLTTTQGEEITLYAQWEYVPRTVTFDVGEGFTVTKDGKDVRTVDVLTQENPINTVKAKDIPVPNEREGWVFQGWYTEKDGKGDLVVPGGASKATVFKTDSTVYAYWKEFEPVTVTLNAKGGTMRISGKNVSSTTMDTKWPGVLDGALPTPGRTNYKFLGWYTGAGIKVDENTVFLRDTTIYARWQRAVSRTGNPKTGDQVRLGLAIGILAVAAAGLGAAVVIKKRKK